MISDLLFWCGIFLSLYAIYKWYTKHNDYFEKRGVSYEKPKSFVGVIIELIFKPKSMVEFMTQLYEKNPGYK